MGLFDKTTNTTGQNVQQSTANVTSTPYGPTQGAFNTLIGGVNKNLKYQPAINADSQQGYGLLRNLAGQGLGPQYDQANGYLSSLFQQAQQPVSMSPYQDAVVNPMAQKATASALSQASMSGRYGSNASTQNVAQNVTDAVMPYMSQEWNNAQARHTANQGLAMQGMGMLPQLQQMQYMPAQALIQSGQMQDQSIWDRFKNAGSILGVAGQMGGTKTSTGTTIQNNAGTQKTPSTALQDVAGIGGIFGSFL